MNINNIATAAPVESMPLEVSTPVSAPVEVDAAQKAYNQPDSNRQTEKPKGDELSAEQTKQLAAELNEISDDLQTNLGFSIREDLDHTVIVQIKNLKTDELIRQIPSEELLTIREKMLELTGLLLDHSI